MTRILHISDTHFGTVTDRIENALLAMARESRPDLVLLSGDITQRARRRQFAAAARFIRSLPAPVLAIPGNHDIPLYNLLARWRNPYGNYRHAIDRELQPQFHNDALLVLGVNSTRAWRHIDGELSDRQIETIARRLSNAQPEQLRVVMLHHPVRAVAAPDIANLVHGHLKAVPRWVDAGLDLLVAGHIHLPYVRKLHGASRRHGWSVQAGTSLSWRIRGEWPNSLNLIQHRFENGQHHCSVERWDFREDRDRFQLATHQELEISR